MFNSFGLGLADVRFSVRRPDGSLEPLDYYSSLGYGSSLEAPSSVRRIRGLKGVQSITARLCETLGPEVDLRARVRIAHRYGWQSEITETDGNLCRRDDSH